eukprot:27597-Prorocentrum_minimum.AAC.1
MPRVCAHTGGPETLRTPRMCADPWHGRNVFYRTRFGQEQTKLWPEILGFRPRIRHGYPGIARISGGPPWT